MHILKFIDSPPRTMRALCGLLLLFCVGVYATTEYVVPRPLIPALIQLNVTIQYTDGSSPPIQMQLFRYIFSNNGTEEWVGALQDLPVSINPVLVKAIGFDNLSNILYGGVAIAETATDAFSVMQLYSRENAFINTNNFPYVVSSTASEIPFFSNDTIGVFFSPLIVDLQRVYCMIQNGTGNQLFYGNITYLEAFDWLYLMGNQTSVDCNLDFVDFLFTYDFGSLNWVDTYLSFNNSCEPVPGFYSTQFAIICSGPDVEHEIGAWGFFFVTSVYSPDAINLHPDNQFFFIVFYTPGKPMHLRQVTDYMAQMDRGTLDQDTLLVGEPIPPSLNLTITGFDTVFPIINNGTYPDRLFGWSWVYYTGVQTNSLCVGLITPANSFNNYGSDQTANIPIQAAQAELILASLTRPYETTICYLTIGIIDTYNYILAEWSQIYQVPIYFQNPLLTTSLSPGFVGFTVYPAVGQNISDDASTFGIGGYVLFDSAVNLLPSQCLQSAADSPFNTPKLSALDFTPNQIVTPTCKAEQTLCGNFDCTSPTVTVISSDISGDIPFTVYGPCFDSVHCTPQYGVYFMVDNVTTLNVPRIFGNYRSSPFVIRITVSVVYDHAVSTQIFTYQGPIGINAFMNTFNYENATATPTPTGIRKRQTRSNVAVYQATLLELDFAFSNQNVMVGLQRDQIDQLLSAVTTQEQWELFDAWFVGDRVLSKAARIAQQYTGEIVPASVADYSLTCTDVDAFKTQCCGITDGCTTLAIEQLEDVSTVCHSCLGLEFVFRCEGLNENVNQCLKMSPSTPFAIPNLQDYITSCITCLTT